ncbi:isoamyl acetate-hydrolyzing esterase [Saccharomycopsis crataegensis]|uniref:Isoamyl acetate-hydrolyzing esterase n=1 Tax=Saccharomycopsis crataegensis TaxID=43959 RepID=A0AAV5QNP0_9ASCO|nr:isoamyl acetate-hydrolyzing esterase [Saccharomycopsis crataegensis]
MATPTNVTYKLTYDKFLLFGDSITEYSYSPLPLYPTGHTTTPEFNFGGYLTDIYTRKLAVTQRGYAGYNSEQARVLYPKILDIEHTKDSKVLFSTIFFGTNDATMGDSAQSVELERYEENMRFIIQTALDRDIKVVVFGPGFHDPERWSIRLTEVDIAGGRFRSNESNKIYSDKLQQVCEELKVPFVCLYDMFVAYEGDWKKDLLTDGIHFTGKGYQLMTDGLMKAIKENYPELLPEALPMILPPWRELVTTEELPGVIENAN